MRLTVMVIGFVLACVTPVAAAEPCLDMVWDDPGSLQRCYQYDSGSGVRRPPLQTSDACYRFQDQFRIRIAEARNPDLAGRLSAKRLRDQPAPRCDVIAQMIADLFDAPAAWAGCTDFDPDAGFMPQAEACVAGYLAARQGRAGGDETAARHALATMDCQRFLATYETALADGAPEYLAADGRILRLPRRYERPPCSPVTKRLTALRAQRDAAQQEAQRQAAARATEARAQREAERAARRDARIRAAQAREDQRRAALAQPQTAQSNARDGAAEGAGDDGLTPGQREAIRTFVEKAQELSEAQARVDAARKTLDSRLDALEAARAGQERASQTTQPASSDAVPDNAAVRDAFRAGLRRRYKQADCLYGFRSNLVGFPNIEVCVNYIRIRSDCVPQGAYAAECLLSYRVNITSPTHPGMTPRLQQQNYEVDGKREYFSRRGDTWVWTARDAEIDRHVDREFRGRAPFGAP